MSAVPQGLGFYFGLRFRHPVGLALELPLSSHPRIPKPQLVLGMYAGRSYTLPEWIVVGRSPFLDVVSISGQVD